MNREEKRRYQRAMKKHGGTYGRDEEFAYWHNPKKAMQHQDALGARRDAHGEGKSGGLGKQSPWDGPQ